MKYECELIKDLLPLYHDKATSDFSSKVVEEHLNVCADCRCFYQEVKKTADIPFKSISSTADAGYLSFAKRLRRTKWYWRFAVGLLVGCITLFSLMYAEGNRLTPINAVYASNSIDEHAKLLATVPMGSERILYIYDDAGLYREIDVTYRFPYWKYTATWPNRSIEDTNAGMQLITRKSYGNSLNNSLYIVFAVAVHDERVAYVELGKEDKMQRQSVESSVTVFYWDETGAWDGTATWDGMIKDSQLRGAAYAKDGTVLYNLMPVHEPSGQDTFQWISADSKE